MPPFAAGWLGVLLIGWKVTQVNRLVSNEYLQLSTVSLAKINYLEPLRAHPSPLGATRRKASFRISSLHESSSGISLLRQTTSLKPAFTFFRPGDFLCCAFVALHVQLNAQEGQQCAAATCLQSVKSY